MVKDGPSLPHLVRPFCLTFDHLEKTWLQNMGRKGGDPNLSVVLNFQHTNGRPICFFFNSEREYNLTRRMGITFYIINTTAGIITVNET